MKFDRSADFSKLLEVYSLHTKCEFGDDTMTTLPTPKDPMSTAIEKGIEEAAKAATGFLEKLVGPSLDEGGGIIGDTVAYWRFRNKVNLVLKAKAFLEAKNIAPERLLPKVVAPLLEAGSLEEEPEMQSRWAALLASAASDPKRVPPAFPKILSEISSTEARILEWLTDRVQKEVGWVAAGEEVRSAHKLATWEYEVLMGNLVRLNLCRPSFKQVDFEDSSAYHSTEWASYQRIEFTRLGRAFVWACRAPDNLTRETPETLIINEPPPNK